MSARIRILFFLVFLGLALVGVPARAAEFSAPEAFTLGSEKFRLARTANQLMAADSRGRLHLAYWSGSEFGTTPDRPSRVYYQVWDPSTGWRDRIQVDQSVSSGGMVLGGRHPSLALLRDEEVWITWNDSRHSTQSGNWIDNLEIYADRKTAEEDFIPGDIRLTETLAGHLGDNGFTPKVVADKQGRLSFVWFDFHFHADVADLMLLSVTSAIPLPPPPLEDLRLTDQQLRGGTPSFTVPDLAVDSEGTRHLVWVGGFGAEGDLYYASLTSEGDFSGPQLLAPGAADFFDPPHITVSPADDVLIVHGDDSVPGGEDVVLRIKAAGQSAFEEPVSIDSKPARQYSPDAEVDGEGNIHLVWLEEGGGNRIQYALLEGASGTLSEIRTLSRGAGNWVRPSIELHDRGFVYAVWEENVGINSGRLWFTTTAEPVPLSVEDWRVYE